MHTPSEVKAAVTGSGRADKDQVGTMVARILGLAEAPKPADASDAVALALCQLWRGRATARLAAATVGAGVAVRPGAPPGRAPGPVSARPATARAERR